MPTYEYECTQCGHTFDVFQRITADPLSSCPKCKGTLRRLIGGGMGVIFKGSGFYTTDYKKGSALAGPNGSREKTKEKGSEAGAAAKGGDAGSAAKSESGTEKAPVS